MIFVFILALPFLALYFLAMCVIEIIKYIIERTNDNA